VIGLLFFVLNLFIFGFVLFGYQSIYDLSIQSEETVNEAEYVMLEILNHIDKIIFRGQTDSELKTMFEKSENARQNALGFYNASIFQNTVLTICAIMTCLFVLQRFIRHSIQDGGKDATTLFITMFTLLTLYRDRLDAMIQSVPEIVEYWGRVAAMLNHFDDISKKWEILEGVGEAGAGVKIQSGLVFRSFCLENVTFRYKNSMSDVFHDFTFFMDTPHQILGIRGVSGQGKSTLAKLLLRMYKPQQGRVTIDGVDIQEVDPDYLRKNIIYVNQNSKLFDKKVIENMLYGCPEKECCQKVLGDILKYPKIRQLYQNMDIHEKEAGSLGENLSGGQRQITNMIAGMVAPAKILILDEPTNALDHDLKMEVIALIQEIRKYKQYVIIITHDRDVYPLFDKTLDV
jgi:ABC-type bacteriocin/lantibiotic exporter with double-glycine peptidase domain